MKRRGLLPLLLTIILTCSAPEAEPVVYTLAALFVKAEGEDEIFINAPEMTQEQHARFDPVVAAYGETVKVGKKTIQFSGSAFSPLNPCIYRVSEGKIVFDRAETSAAIEEALLSETALSLRAVSNAVRYEFVYASPGAQDSEMKVRFVSEPSYDIPEQTLSFGTDAEIPAGPKLPYREFLGFYADSEFTRFFDFGRKLFANTVVYLKWSDAAMNYRLVRLTVKENNLPDCVVDPGNMTEQEEILFGAFIMMYGDEITGNDKILKFSGIMLADFSPAKHGGYASNVVFEDPVLASGEIFEYFSYGANKISFLIQTGSEGAKYLFEFDLIEEK